MKSEQKKSKEKKASSPYRWAFTAFLMAVVLSAILTLASEAILSGAGLIVALLLAWKEKSLLTVAVCASAAAFIVGLFV